MTEPTQDGSATHQPQHGEPQPAGPSADAQRPAGTGHPRVDAAVGRLTDIAGLAPAEQVDGYDHIHRELSETLAALDDR
jgi:hypothetical protein